MTPDTGLHRLTTEEPAMNDTDSRAMAVVENRPLRLDDFLTLSDDDIGRIFAGSFGAPKRREAVELIRELARLEKVKKAKYPIFDGA